jgi:hypothetical protein
VSTVLHPPRSLPHRELVVPVLAVLIVAVLPMAVWGRLPDPVAIHWGLDGRPDGSAPLIVDVVLLTVLTALVTLLPLLAVVRGDRHTARTMLALAHGMGAFFVLLRWRTLALNLDAAGWSEAGSLTLGRVAVMALGAAPFALLGWWLGGLHPDLPRPEREPVRHVLPPDGQLVWVGRQSWAIARLLGPALIASGGVIAALRVALETSIVGSTLMLVGILLWWFTTITVAAGPAGLKVRFGPLGWPAIRVPLSAIERIAVEDIEPLAHGGWGYRVTPGVRAVVIRRGVGLRVVRTGRPDLIVTIDDAANAAGVLAAHLEAYRTGAGD